MPGTHKANIPDSPAASIWLRVLACLALVIVACGLKNYLAVAVSGTALCPNLCPSVFPTELVFSFPLLEWWFETQRGILEKTQALVDPLSIDRWHLATSILIVPVYEELIFRGPLFLARGLVRNSLWWLIGSALTIIFALSHGRRGLALLPLLVLGTCGLWLIAITHRFWPTLALHILHNFFFTSVLIYQSTLLAD